MFHRGELKAQAGAGEAELGAANGRIIRPELARGADAFILGLPFAVAASVNATGQPWASPLVGPPGSFAALGPRHVAIHRGALAADDPLGAHLTVDPRIGLLFFEPGTRRRYRVNGSVADATANPLVVEIAEAYPNCPKYLTRRALRVGPPASAVDATAAGATLGPEEQAILRGVDALFVASADPTGQLDASHRGGAPGFVELGHGDTLRIPDYAGNGMYNTLGNLLVEPRVALLAVGRESSLHLTGTAAVTLTGKPGAAGAGGRAWSVAVTGWRRAPLARRLEAGPGEPSPFNPPVRSADEAPQPAAPRGG